MTVSLAVAGKGGTGKSTIAALLVQALRAKKAGPVLAVDADPDSNLGTLLGVGDLRSVGELREEMRGSMRDFPAGMSKASFMEANLHGIVAEAEGFDLVTMGRGEGPGCYCYLNSLIRAFSDSIMQKYAWVVMDNEAGLEHISRRTSGDLDHLLVVVNESPLSWNCAESIEKLTRGLDRQFRRRYIVTNKARPGSIPAMEERAARLGLPVLGHVPHDEAAAAAVLEGRPLDAAGLPKIMESIKNLVSRMEEKHAGS